MVLGCTRPASQPTIGHLKSFFIFFCSTVSIKNQVKLVVNKYQVKTKFAMLNNYMYIFADCIVHIVRRLGGKQRASRNRSLCNQVLDGNHTETNWQFLAPTKPRDRAAYN